MKEGRWGGGRGVRVFWVFIFKDFLFLRRFFLKGRGYLSVKVDRGAGVWGVRKALGVRERREKGGRVRQRWHRPDVADCWLMGGGTRPGGGAGRGAEGRVEVLGAATLASDLGGFTFDPGSSRPLSLTATCGLEGEGMGGGGVGRGGGGRGRGRWRGFL